MNRNANVENINFFKRKRQLKLNKKIRSRRFFQFCECFWLKTLFFVITRHFESLLVFSSKIQGTLIKLSRTLYNCSLNFSCLSLYGEGYLSLYVESSRIRHRHFNIHQRNQLNHSKDVAELECTSVPTRCISNLRLSGRISRSAQGQRAMWWCLANGVDKEAKRKWVLSRRFRWATGRTGPSKTAPLAVKQCSPFSLMDL